MRTTKRILAVFLSVCLLSLSVGSSWFDSRHMTQVEAASVAAGAGLTAATLFQICLFVGAVAGTCYVAGEVMEHQEQIARAGKNFIDSVTEIPEGWILRMTEASGQEYVFGSEALAVVQATGWDVIQGGGPSGDDHNDDDDKGGGDKKGLLDLFHPANQMVGSFTALGAAWFYDNASRLYQKWAGGAELSPAEQAVIDPFLEGYIDSAVTSAQWTGKVFPYQGRTGRIDGIRNGTANYQDYYEYVQFQFDSQLPVAGTYYTGTMNVYDPAIRTTRAVTSYCFSVYCLQADGSSKFLRAWDYYHRSPSGFSQEGLFHDYKTITWQSSTPFSLDCNFPVFASAIEAQNYLAGTAPVTDALNYAQIYREADWLSEDWRGVLIDPLADIALSLSQLIDLAKALGLHAVGRSLSPSELSDLIARSLPAVNPDLLPGAAGVPAIVPDPALDPIYYPHAGAHPALQPVPGPEPDPGPVTPSPDPGDGDTDAGRYKVDLTSIFPFCIPFDFIALLRVLDADPVAPRFEFPVVIPALDYRSCVILDLSPFDDVARILRICENVSFLIFLMFATSKVIRW